MQVVRSYGGFVVIGSHGYVVIFLEANFGVLNRSIYLTVRISVFEKGVVGNFGLIYGAVQNQTLINRLNNWRRRAKDLQRQP